MFDPMRSPTDKIYFTSKTMGKARHKKTKDATVARMGRSIDMTCSRAVVLEKAPSRGPGTQGTA